MRGVFFCIVGLAGSGLLRAQVAQPGQQAKDAATAQAWVGRLDPAAEKRGARITENTVLESGDGLRVTTGASAIYWHPTHTASGTYTVKASFVHGGGSTTEFYGLFIGGSQLQKGPRTTCTVWSPEMARSRCGTSTARKATSWPGVRPVPPSGGQTLMGRRPTRWDGGSRRTGPRAWSTAPRSGATRPARWWGPAGCCRPTARRGSA